MEENAEKRTNPYLGPEFFTRPVAHLFFGRSREARDLVSMAATERVLLFYAPSGAGKTSLLNAKVIPQLEEKRYEVLPPGRVSGPATPATGVNAFNYNLMLSLARQEEHPERFAGFSLRDFLWHLSTKDGRSYFFDASDQALRMAMPREKLWPRVLIVDQFEEILTHYPSRSADREDFFRRLDEALHADPMLRVILSMRSDFVPGLDRYEGLFEGGLRARYHMLPLTTANAKEAIEEPAKLPDYNHPFAEGMADKLVANMSQVREVDPNGAILTRPGEWVEPIQLQVVCYQLWERLWPNLAATPGANITMDGLKHLAPTEGAMPEVMPADEEILLASLVDGALADFYADALARALAASGGRVDESQLRDWFSTRLITESGARNFLERKADGAGGIPEEVVKVLVDEIHLLRSDRRGNVDLVELVHDRFVQPIREANFAWNEHRIQEQPWIAAGLKWHRSGADPESRDRSLLLRDEALAAVVAQKTAGQRFEPAIEEFLRVSQEVQEEQRQKRKVAQLEQEKNREAKARTKNRRLAWLAFVCFLGALVAVFYAIQGWNQANHRGIELKGALDTARVARNAAEAGLTVEVAAGKTREALNADIVIRQTEALWAYQTKVAEVTAANLGVQDARATAAMAQAAVQALLATRSADLQVALTQAAPTATPIPTPRPPETPGEQRTVTPSPVMTPTRDLAVIAQQTQLVEVQKVQTRLAASTATAIPTISPPRGRIVYTSNRGNPSVSLEAGSKLWAIRLALGDRTPLTFRTGFEPAYSQARDTIAFTSILSDVQVDLFEMPSAGGDPRAMDDHSWSDWEPSYSPDGRRVAFTSSRNNQSWEIWTMGVDGGSNPQQLTSDDPARNWTPAWSPDGKYIAYFSSREAPAGQVEVWRMDANGNNKTRLTIRNWTEQSPDSIWGRNWEVSWSPDSKRLAFPSNRDGNWEIYIMDRDGRNQRNLTQSPGTDEFDPAWSLDGNWIALARNTPNGQMIVLKSIDGRQEIPLTSGGHVDRNPAWTR